MKHFLLLNHVHRRTAASLPSWIMVGLEIVRAIRSWAFTFGLAVSAAVLWHLVRVYPWHQLYLSESDFALFDHLAPEPIGQHATCFSPRSASVITTIADFDMTIGSFIRSGLNRDRCFHYASRFEPYLASAWNNTYIAQAQERIGMLDASLITNDLVWYANLLAENDPAAFLYVDWSNLTISPSCSTTQDTVAASQAPNLSTRQSRIAFVLRCYQGFVWTQDAILHLRALIWELRMAHLPFYVDVHLLLDVKDAASHASTFSAAGRKQILRGSVPIEFWSITTLWSERETILRYPLYGDFRQGIEAAGSYRGCLLALQRFAAQHLEYDQFINWEMDTRFTHTYDHLLESIYTYAFEASAETYTRWPIERSGARASAEGICRNTSADVVVFSPVRNPQGADWYWEYDVQGFATRQATSRAASVGTNLWLSRRALMELERMTADEHQSLFCEAMAPSLVFRSPQFVNDQREGSDAYNRSRQADGSQCREQFKLVHYPHPVAFKYQALQPHSTNCSTHPTRSYPSTMKKY